MAKFVFKRKSFTGKFAQKYAGQITDAKIINEGGSGILGKASKVLSTKKGKIGAGIAGAALLGGALAASNKKKENEET